jgi:aminoglycoside/choline kinase family phosphotransferase
MTLPRKADKGYLLLTHRGDDGFVIVAAKEHAAELVPLFAQHGLPCRRQLDLVDGHDTLHFDAAMDPKRITEVLDGYKEAKGS